MNIRNSYKYFFQIVWLAGVILLVGCGPEPITEQNFDTEEIAPFVEPDFPFITTSIDARELGPGFPDDNIVPRCLALRLGSEAYTCFDTDMLRWSVAWTGDFVPMVTMAQISYRDFYNKDNEIPLIGGDPKIATGLYPGWSGASPGFTDPRPPSPHPQSPSWGPIPSKIGRWNGVYLNGQDVVMSYSVQGIDIYEKPGSIHLEDQTGFSRTIRVKESHSGLTLVAAEVSDGTRSEVADDVLFIYHGKNEEKVTAVGLAKSSKGVKLDIINDRHAIVRLASGHENQAFTLVLWQGASTQQNQFVQLTAQADTEMPDFKDGGSAYWTETVRTRGQVAPDTAAFVTDQLTLPIPNPWKRNVRVADVAFFEDNRVALVTFEGDVWIVDGIDEDLRELTWNRYASGLYEPQSIEIVRDTVYVFGKDGIIRFHDLNNDGEADYYENFSNLMEQSIETREWASDMVASPDGGFYVSKFGALDMGPETSSPKSLMGFRAGSNHDGSILKVSPDGKSIKHYATGFRGPYLGIHPETGVLSASDQQGHYMPSTAILLVNEGDYYGVPATAHRNPLPEVTPPLTWIPHNVDRSGTGQVWITSDKMGPLSGQMVHMSYGKPGLFKVLIDSTGDDVQGAVTVIRGKYPAPIMKGAVSPADGQLYMAGFSLWGSNSDQISAFTRLRYTGKESMLPQKFQVRDGGIIVRFSQELDADVAANNANYQVKRWNYQRTEQYGSGHFKPNGEPGEEQIPVFSAHLSVDKKGVFIVVPNIEEVMQMEFAYNLKTSNGTALSNKLWFTVNNVTKPDLLAEGFNNLNSNDLSYNENAQLVVNTRDEPITVERGQELFQQAGCIDCHSVRETSDGQLGPALKGLFGSNQQFEDGSTTVADEVYLQRSILQPGEKIVKGYAQEMPSFLGVLSEQEVESIVLYIKSLSN